MLGEDPRLFSAAALMSEHIPLLLFCLLACPRRTRMDDEYTSYANLETNLYAFYSGSVHKVIARAEANTSPELLGLGADYFPLYYSDRAENGNYVESDEIAVRHGVCGDPGVSGGLLAV